MHYFIIIFFVNEDYYILVPGQFSAGSNSLYIFNKKLSMEVFFSDLVSDQRFGSCKVVEKLSTFRVNFVRCTGVKSSCPGRQSLTAVDIHTLSKFSPLYV